MYSHPFHKWIAASAMLLLAAFLLCLPAAAMPARMTDNASRDGMLGEASSIIDDVIDETGNLGDTDGDGVIERRSVTEQDPAHAADEAMEGGNGWIVAAICVVAVISMILVIVALIPKRRR